MPIDKPRKDDAIEHSVPNFPRKEVDKMYATFRGDRCAVWKPDNNKDQWEKVFDQLDKDECYFV